MAELYPTYVVLNQQNTEKLIKTFETAQVSIEKKITTATDWGVKNRREILAQIDDILIALGADAEDTFAEELPIYYEDGANLAVKQLKNVKAKPEVAAGFNRVHVQTINALVDEASRAFGESLSGVSRNVNTLLGKATRELLTQKLAEGLIAGDALTSVRKEIKILLEEQGLSAIKSRAFTNKNGTVIQRTWTLKDYGEMLFRTKAVEAHNRGLMNRMVENSFDLVQVSNHNSSHRECAVWEGKILSITGSTSGFPTVAEAEKAGLFHPNCQHTMNALTPSLARITQAYYPDLRARQIDEEQMAKLEKLGLV